MQVDAAGTLVCRTLMIKAALFDVFGTCVDWRSGVADYVRPLLVSHDLDPGLAEQIADDWRRLYDPSMARVRDGERPYVALEVIQRENLDRVLDGLAIAHRLKDDARDQLNRAWEHLPAWPDTIDALERLKEKIPIAACSNGSKSMMERLAARTNLPWSMILGAATGQNFKPHRDVYLKSCAALSTKPAETLMVACHPDDLDAAASLGLKTAYFPRAHEWGDVPFEADPNAKRFTLSAPTISALVDEIVKAA